jgi:hypothetical protein
MRFLGELKEEDNGTPMLILALIGCILSLSWLIYEIYSLIKDMQKDQWKR